MYKIRNGYYYLFNSKTGKEKIVYIENNNLTNVNALSENDSFTLGTYLSGVIETLNFLRDNTDGIPSYSKVAQLIMARSDYLPTKDNTYVNMLVHCIYFCFQNAMKNDNLYFENNNLNYFQEYVELCTKHKELCNLNKLLKYASLKAITLHREEQLISEIEKDGNTTLEFLKESPKIIPDIYIYKIDTITDLLLSFLQAIFLKGKIIKECENCYRIFVPLKRNDEKYCSYSVIGDDDVCKNQGYEYNRKTHFANKDIHCMYDKIRKRLYNKREYFRKERPAEDELKLQTEYNTFLEKYREFADDIANQKLTEEDLYIWLIKKEEETKSI